MLHDFVENLGLTFAGVYILLVEVSLYSVMLQFTSFARMIIHKDGYFYCHRFQFVKQRIYLFMSRVIKKQQCGLQMGVTHT